MTDSPRFVCIHGHFYQPPRENAWLEMIELQESAQPFHDWNQRIDAECYWPNATARVLDRNGRIARIVNNYERISFNFGPTLLSWMERQAPETYSEILAADRASATRFGGHGSALAQAYGHAILPLCNRRDKQTHIRWGIEDFRRRFGREPEGMWLPETAVDLETLAVLADHGIAFTLLAPSQAQAVRSGHGAWHGVVGAEAKINPRRAYGIELPGGRTMSLFFYDGATSRAVAFERLLNRGESFVERLLGAFQASTPEAQLVHIATDGETYGHHHAFGEMALAFALELIEQSDRARLTNYGEFLEHHPPIHEVRIRQNTAWSCAHGLGRWSNDCGCSTGGRPGWNQAWRAPLRDALDWLRDALEPRFVEAMARFVDNPWATRDDYIRVISDRSPANRDGFIQHWTGRQLSDEERTEFLQLLELQRHAVLMYTSCGWFFDELSGIENRQVLQFAARAIQLAEALFGGDWREPFLERLALAPSNLREVQDGRRLFERDIAPQMVGAPRIAAHVAARLLFDLAEAELATAAYDIQIHDQQRFESERGRMVIAHLGIGSSITQSSDDVVVALLHPGRPELVGGVSPFRSETDHRSLLVSLTRYFSEGDMPALAEQIRQRFGHRTISLSYLFRDDQQYILRRLIESTLGQVEATYEALYSHHGPLMRDIARLDTAQPRPLRVAAELVVNSHLRRELTSADLDPQQLERWVAEAQERGIALDEAGLGFAARHTLRQWMRIFEANPNDGQRLEKMTQLARWIRGLPFGVDLRDTETRYYRTLQRHLPSWAKRAQNGDPDARSWLATFVELGSILNVTVPELGDG